MTDITSVVAVECAARTDSAAASSLSPVPASLAAAMPIRMWTMSAMGMRVRTMCAMRMRHKGSG
jgi:hypothetical protein